MARIPAKKIPRRQRSSITREEIITAAGKVLEEHGAEKVTMRLIAQRIGCSLASPYVHFTNRAEIWRMLVVRGEEQLTATLRRAEAGHAETYGKLNLIAHAYWDFATQNRQLHRLMFGMRDRSLYGEKLSTLPSSYRVFLDTIRRGIETGEIPHPRRSYLELGRTLWSWMYGLLTLELNGLVRKSERDDPVQRGIDLFHIMLKNAHIAK